MPLYQSDFVPLIMRAVEALDRGERISFDDLRQRIAAGDFLDLIQEAGHYPMPAIPDADFQELTDAVHEVLDVNRGDEGEHFYVTRNGYCLLIAALWEVNRKNSQDIERPLPER